MLNSNRKTFAVIGAGPKGLAVAVKSKVLQEFGFPADDVILIEKHRVAAHWTGDFGYTNGELKLGTSPEKDVVFPIETDVGDPLLNEQIRQRLLQFSWFSFLVQTQRYSDWIDRGRPAPCHQSWVQYLLWVSEQLAPQVRIIVAEVIAIDLTHQEDQWELLLRSSDCEQTLVVDRLMITGPGKTKRDFKTENLNGIYDLESFWDSVKTKKFLTEGRLAIVGAGENAASVLLTLSHIAPNIKLDIISPKGFVSTRAENFYENQFYSQPERNGWTDLDMQDRKTFIERTDLGVFSVHAMNILNDQTHHRIVPGRLTAIALINSSLSLTVEYAQKIFYKTYDQVILATGFDQLSMIKAFFSPRALKALEKSVGEQLDQKNVELRIQNDLSVKDMKPPLHLPMLSRLTQGPGFANLSCLGKLSDRIFMSNLHPTAGHGDLSLGRALDL